MKKIILACIVCMILMCSCCSTTEMGAAENPSMFVAVEEETNYKIVYHRDTKVMYTISIGQYNKGSFTVLLNPDGTPMLYEGDL